MKLTALVLSFITVFFLSGCYEHGTKRYVITTTDAITIKGALPCRNCDVRLRAEKAYYFGTYEAFIGEFDDLTTTYTRSSAMPGRNGWYEFSFDNIVIPKAYWRSNFLSETAHLKAFWTNPETGREEAISGFDYARHDYGEGCLDRAKSLGEDGATYCGLTDVIAVDMLRLVPNESTQHCIDDLRQLGITDSQEVFRRCY